MCQLKNTSSLPPLTFHQKRTFGTAVVTVASKIYSHSGIDCHKWNDRALVDIYSGKRNRARTQKLTPSRIAQQFENWVVHLHLWNPKDKYCVYTYQKVDLNKTVPTYITLTFIFKLQKILYFHLHLGLQGITFSSGSLLNLFYFYISRQYKFVVQKLCCSMYFFLSIVLFYVL
jgi:hypothetical protein